MKHTDLDNLIPYEINELIQKELDSGIENVYTTKEWFVTDNKKITNDKLVDMYETILRIRELEKILKK